MAEGWNCNETPFPGGRNEVMCSVASKLLLAYPTNGGSIEVLVNVQLDWSRPDLLRNTFECDKTISTLDNRMWFDHKKIVAGDEGWKQDKILPFVFCADDDCLKQGHNMGEPWHEIKKCKSLIDWPRGCEPGAGGPDNPETRLGGLLLDMRPAHEQRECFSAHVAE
jgi:hypothetical protein